MRRVPTPGSAANLERLAVEPSDRLGCARVKISLLRPCAASPRPFAMKRALELSLALSILLSACTTAKPPKRPPPPPPVEKVEEKAPEPPPPPPPPPPKCESLSESCKVEADRRLSMAGGTPSAVLPTGWTYAKEAEALVAMAPTEEAVMAVAKVSGTGDAAEQAAVAKLLERLAITDLKMPSLKQRWKKAQSTQDAGGVAVKLWEVDKQHQGSDPKRKDQPGVALVAVAPLASGPVVVLCFVTRESKGGPVPLMMDAIKSLRGGT
jgi:hypothetical protein